MICSNEIDRYNKLYIFQCVLYLARNAHRERIGDDDFFPREKKTPASSVLACSRKIRFCRQSHYAITECVPLSLSLNDTVTVFGAGNRRK